MKNVMEFGTEREIFLNEKWEAHQKCCRDVEKDVLSFNKMKLLRPRGSYKSSSTEMVRIKLITV